MKPDIWIVGDPHESFRRVTQLALGKRPAAVIFLGDLELPDTASSVFADLLRAKIQVRYIPGNHDSDRANWWRFLADDVLSDSLNLHGRCEDICGLRIAGLGGIFRTKAWNPDSTDPPTYHSYADLERKLSPHWMTPAQRARRVDYERGQLLTHRTTIFPDVYERLATMRADVLATHEGPGGEGYHDYGWEAIADLAEMMGVRRAFHGHLHQRVVYPPRNGVTWCGVGCRQIVDLDRVEIA